MTRTMPFLLIILHLSHIFLTDGLTFIISSFICCTRSLWMHIYIP